MSTGSSNYQGEGPRHSTERSLDQSPTQGEGTGPSHAEKTRPPCQQEYQCEFTSPIHHPKENSYILMVYIFTLNSPFVLLIGFIITYMYSSF